MLTEQRDNVSGLVQFQHACQEDLRAQPVCQGLVSVQIPLTVQGVKGSPPEDQGVVGLIFDVEVLRLLQPATRPMEAHRRGMAAPSAVKPLLVRQPSLPQLWDGQYRRCPGRHGRLPVSVASRCWFWVPSDPSRKPPPAVNPCPYSTLQYGTMYERGSTN